MLSILLLVAAAIWIPGTILLIVHARMAPLGVEDENGFRAVGVVASPLEHPPVAHAVRAG